MAESGTKESKEIAHENDHFWRFPTSLKRRSLSKTKPQSDEVGSEIISLTNPEFTRYE